ncbi:MAG: DUF4347 domain-containing protein [Gammaproteobacteria bacterium]|jgi:hypothetical protein
MLNFIKRRVQHLKQHRSKLAYEGAHDSYGSQKMSVSDSLQALEPRIMFDAAGVVTGAEIAADNVAQEQAEQALIPENLQAQAVNDENEQAEELAAALVGLVPPADRNEIIFIDKSVEDYQSLLAEVSSDAELVFIDGNSDGLEQIANILETRTDIDAIHIISHGESGELKLGNTTLTQESMQGEHTDELATIVQADKPIIEGIVTTADLSRIKGQASARFIPDNPRLEPVWAYVKDIELANLKVLDIPELASIYGGKVPVQFDKRQQLVPDKSAYKVRFSISQVEDVSVDKMIRGVVHVQGEAESYIERMYKKVASVFIRESGF